MKAKTFENLIRKIVREEIDYALRREIKDLKEDILNSKSVIKEQPINKEIKNSLKEKFTQSNQFTSTDVPKPNVNFTNNSTLNDLLNETAQGDTRLNEGMSPVSMEGDFNAIGNMPVEAAPPEVANAVNRDYRDLMKAIDKKRKHRP